MRKFLHADQLLFDYGALRLDDCTLMCALIGDLWHTLMALLWLGRFSTSDICMNENENRNESCWLSCKDGNKNYLQQENHIEYHDCRHVGLYRHLNLIEDSSYSATNDWSEDGVIGAYTRHGKILIKNLLLCDFCNGQHHRRRLRKHCP